MTFFKRLATALLLTRENLFRFVVMLLFLFWQGGFLFYSTVVIYVASEQLGGHRESGFITQHVSNCLNLAAVPALIALFLNWRLNVRIKRPLSRVLFTTWLIMLLTLIGTAVMHPSLDELLQPKTHVITDPKTFRRLHQIYLNTTTVQWAAAMLHLWCVLASWNFNVERSFHSVQNGSRLTERSRNCVLQNYSIRNQHSARTLSPRDEPDNRS